PDGPLVRGPLVRGPLVRGSLVRGRLVLGLVLHQLQQPVLLLRLLGSGRPAATTHTAGVHEGEAARDSAQTPVGLAMTDGDDLLAFAPLLDLDGAGVPDAHRSPAVLVLRHRAFERSVLPGLALGLHSQTLHP